IHIVSVLCGKVTKLFSYYNDLPRHIVVVILYFALTKAVGGKAVLLCWRRNAGRFQALPSIEN
uniref:hypothetical protein n=1 Tax=uncultured Muribaculum sp. TaxID=1918613 RepID=UPI0025B6AF85